MVDCKYCGHRPEGLFVEVTIAQSASVAGHHSSLIRVYLLIQFTSQVFPPSSENACSDWAVSEVIPQIENRTSTDLPLISS